MTDKQKIKIITLRDLLEEIFQEIIKNYEFEKEMNKTQYFQNTYDMYLDLQKLLDGDYDEGEMPNEYTF